MGIHKDALIENQHEGDDMGTLHFKSKENYLKYLAYGQIHGVFKKVPGHQKIYIGGKYHKVMHA